MSPVLDSIGSARVYGWGALSVKKDYWISLISGTGTQSANSVSLDSDKNVYIAYEGNGYGFIKLNKYADTIEWQKQYGAGDPYKAVTDSSGNSYIVGSTPGITVKYNSSGSVVWAKSWATFYQRAAFISGSDIYIGGGGDQAAVITKIDSNGNTVWQRKLDDTSNNDNCLAINASSSNVYGAGVTAANGWDPIVFKYNSSGTLQWQKRINATSGFDFVSGYGQIGLDSSESVYWTWYGAPVNYNEAFIVKHNSSGTLQWMRKIANSTSNIEFIGMTTDSSDNVYGWGNTFISGVGNLIIVKYNSSGSIQWQRRLYSSDNISAYGMHIDGNSMYLAGRIYLNGNNFENLIIKLPTDGTLTGSYSLAGKTFTYQASSLSEAAGGYSDANWGAATSTPSYSSSAASTSDTTTSFTVSSVGV